MPSCSPDMLFRDQGLGVHDQVSKGKDLCVRRGGAEIVFTFFTMFLCSVKSLPVHKHNMFTVTFRRGSLSIGHSLSEVRTRLAIALGNLRSISLTCQTLNIYFFQFFLYSKLQNQA